MKTRPLGNGEYDMVTSEIFIEGSAEKNAMVIGNGYYDSTNFNKDAMTKAFKEVFRRNDVFRMRIIGKSFFKRQYIQEYFEPEIEYHNIEGGREEFANVCKTDVFPNIQLTDSALFKVEIYSCSDGTGGIIIWQHHVISDGQTLLDIIYRQLCEFYTAYKNGDEPKPAKRIYTHDEYIDNRQKQLKKHGLRDILLNIRDSWKYSFRYSLPFCGDYNAKPQIYRKVNIDGEEYKAINDICQNLNCSTPCLLYAIIAMIVYEKTGKRIFKIDTIANGRSTFVLKNTAGNLTTCIPLYFNIKKGQKVSDCINTTYFQFLRVITRVPFSAFITCALFESIPCFTTLNAPWKNRWMQLNYLKFWDNSNAPLESFIIERPEDFMNFYIEFSENKDNISVLFQHSTNIMDEEEGNKIVDLFKRFLIEVAKDPNRSIEDIYTIVK